MQGTRYDAEKAARVLVDAIALGSDRTAAKRHGVSTKTVSRYRERMLTDQELSRLVREKGREAEHTWHIARSRFLTRGIQKLEALVDKATVENMSEVTEALRVIGELEIAREALGVGADVGGEVSPAAEAARRSTEDDEGDR